MMLTFNTACLDAIPAIVALVNESYRPQKPDASWTNESKIVSGNRINMAQAQDLIQNPENTLLLGFNSAELVSCVLVEKTINSAKIGLLTVAIKDQQQGFGKQTLMVAEDYIAKNLGLNKIKMHVLLVRGELIDFYCRLGYQKTGIVKAYPENLGVGKPLIEDLKFEILEKHLIFPVS
jgi:ribosomal protein S18 acetylase RimI-like enzyme